MNKKGRISGRLIKIMLLTSGSIFLLLCLLAFTTLPYHALYRLATSESKIERNPEMIVMLAGAGIPSESGLIRVYYSARLAKEYPDATLVVAVPGKLSDSVGDPQRILEELVFRGVNPQKISFANNSKNTRGQVMEIAEMVGVDHLSLPLTIVTSPEHMKRAVLSFRKIGFTNVSGFPTFESSLATDLTFSDRDLKGNKLAPSIGYNLQVRYQFWNHLKYEVIVIREYFALTYYKIRGWI